MAAAARPPPARSSPVHGSLDALVPREGQSLLPGGRNTVSGARAMAETGGARGRAPLRASPSEAHLDEALQRRQLRHGAAARTWGREGRREGQLGSLPDPGPARACSPGRRYAGSQPEAEVPSLFGSRGVGADGYCRRTESSCRLAARNCASGRDGRTTSEGGEV